MIHYNAFRTNSRAANVVFRQLYLHISIVNFDAIKLSNLKIFEQDWFTTKIVPKLPRGAGEAK